MLAFRFAGYDHDLPETIRRSLAALATLKSGARELFRRDEAQRVAQRRTRRDTELGERSMEVAANRPW